MTDYTQIHGLILVISIILLSFIFIRIKSNDETQLSTVVGILAIVGFLIWDSIKMAIFKEKSIFTGFIWTIATLLGVFFCAFFIENILVKIFSIKTVEDEEKIKKENSIKTKINSIIDNLFNEKIRTVIDEFCQDSVDNPKELKLIDKRQKLYAINEIKNFTLELKKFEWNEIYKIDNNYSLLNEIKEKIDFKCNQSIANILNNEYSIEELYLLGKETIKTQERNSINQPYYKYLFIDVETNGLSLNFNSPPEKYELWPEIVQIAMIICDSNQKILEKADFIVKPNDFIISEESSKIHKITNEYALVNGVEISKILPIIEDYSKRADFYVGHNISFDLKVIYAEFYRNSNKNPLPILSEICTMKSSAFFCQIPSIHGFNYKWPTLQELYLKLFNIKFIDAHNATKDLEATIECFWKLKELNIISNEEGIDLPF